ncbi:class I SAM-dependent DNA methyltransferase [Roseovarius aestuariivivens]|uniref:class I SAM-dependent DNA methyltransferase n=1 Tax=Roseovarius aestuariivivens TaxID=1888910 RepID=UPI0010817E17|nr:class I SAM-dependent methyltransferase [Roseovarius aestuariivivens]
MDTKDLDDVYGAKTPQESRTIYNAWSSSYDADCLSQGFRLPSLAAGLLARHLGATDGMVLDACCGTGLVGETLRLLGYDRITGCDLSPDMLALAEKTGAYARLEEADTSVGLPFDDDAFAGFVCVGAFGPGHAPPVTLEHLARVTRPGGIGVFNLLDGSFEAQGFPPVMDRLAKSGAWEVIATTPSFRPFLLAEPELLSTAYVVQIGPR